MMLGESDNLVNTDKSREIYDKMTNCKYRRIKEIEGGDHYMINWEHTYRDVQKETIQFIQTVLDKKII